MRILNRRILPATWPRTTWSLSSFTRNIAFGRASITSPSNSTLSSLATPFQSGRHLSGAKCDLSFVYRYSSYQRGACDEAPPPRPTAFARVLLPHRGAATRSLPYRVRAARIPSSGCSGTGPHPIECGRRVPAQPGAAPPVCLIVGPFASGVAPGPLGVLVGGAPPPVSLVAGASGEL